MEAYLQSFPLADMKELSSSAPRIIDQSHKVRESIVNQSREVRDGKFLQDSIPWRRDFYKILWL
jgi:hypothetical protein